MASCTPTNPGGIISFEITTTNTDPCAQPPADAVFVPSTYVNNPLTLRRPCPCKKGDPIGYRGMPSHFTFGWGPNFIRQIIVTSP